MIRKFPKRWQAAVDKMEPLVRKAFMAAIADMTSNAQIALVVAAIEQNDYAALFRALNLDPSFLAPLDRAIEGAYIEGGIAALAALPMLKNPTQPGKVIIRFNGRNPRAEAWLKRFSSTEIVDIGDMKVAVRIAMDAGIRAGDNPRRTALRIVGRINRATGRREDGILGLTSNQGQYVENMRSELADPQTARKYLTRQRRDRRFDDLVKKSASTGKALSADQIDTITGRYSDRLLMLRGETIARTETLHALNAGAEEGVNQAIDTGAINETMVTKIWHATGGGRTRATHSAMDGQRRKKGVPFNSPSGARLMYPLDGSLGAPGAEIINCRCYREFRVDYLAGARP